MSARPASAKWLTLANPDWNITLTDAGYSDFLLDNTPGFEGRAYLSGEWARRPFVALQSKVHFRNAVAGAALQDADVPRRPPGFCNIRFFPNKPRLARA